MNRFLMVLKMSFMDSVAYSTSTFLWFGLAMLELLIPMVTWLTATPIGETFGGFTRYQILTYYALMAFVGNATYWWIQYGIAERIRNGDFSNLLLKPLPVLNYLIWYQIGEKIFSFTLRSPVLIIIFYLFNKSIVFSIQGFIGIFGGAIVYLLICLIFSTLAFYLTDLGGIQGLFYFSTYMLSGELAPLSFYPEWFSRIAMVLPHRYILSFPVEIFMGRLDTPQILWGFGIEAVWIILLTVAFWLLWRRALTTYQAYGK